MRKKRKIKLIRDGKSKFLNFKFRSAEVDQQAMLNAASPEIT